MNKQNPYPHHDMKSSNQSRRYLAFPLLRPSLGLALALLGVLLLVWTPPISTAREKITTDQGYVNCVAWCKAHRKTDKGIIACNDACWTYWSKNGSDAPTSNKAGANPTPTPTPPRKYPVKGPPRKLGPTSSPTPSATAKPILLAKPKTTPTPKPTPKKSSHTNSHH
jgi:hypothetical protein